MGLGCLDMFDVVCYVVINMKDESNQQQERAPIMSDKKTVQITQEQLDALMAKVEKLDKQAASRTSYNARRNATHNILLAKAVKAGITASEDEVKAEMVRMAGARR